MTPPESADTVRVGFTGTRHGMTAAQKATVWELLRYDEVTEVHHGDCVGADGDFHDICHGKWPVIIHPPLDPKLRAWCDGDRLPEKHYLERNRDIVAACDWLIATPKEARDTGGGTWYTIKRAIDTGRLVTIVWPDGTAEHAGQDQPGFDGSGALGDDLADGHVGQPGGSSDGAQ